MDEDDAAREAFIARARRLRQWQSEACAWCRRVRLHTIDAGQGGKAGGEVAR